jgi:flagellum-specific ATP synthase
MSIDLGKYHQTLAQINPIRVNGKVSEIIGLIVEGVGPAASIGEICGIYSSSEDDNPVIAEVVGFRNICNVLQNLTPSGELLLCRVD